LWQRFAQLAPCKALTPATDAGRVWAAALPQPQLPGRAHARGETGRICCCCCYCGAPLCMVAHKCPSLPANSHHCTSHCSLVNCCSKLPCLIFSSELLPLTRSATPPPPPCPPALALPRSTPCWHAPQPPALRQLLQPAARRLCRGPAWKPFIAPPLRR